MKRTVVLICLVLLMLALPLAFWRAYLARVINKQLAEIRAAGLPTNGEELNRWYAIVPDDQNGALVLTQAFGLRQTYPDSRSNLIDNFKLPKRGEALSSQQIDLLKGYLDLNEPRLKKADVALKLPTNRYPIDYSMLRNTLLPHLAWLDDIAELHQFKALVSMELGDSSSVTTNIVTMLALARTLDNELCLISQLVRLKLLRRAFATFERRASASPLSAAEIASLAAAFKQTCVTNIVARALIGERAMIIPYFRMKRAEYARINPAKAGEEPKSDSTLPCHGPAILRLIGYYELDYASFLIGMKKAITLSSNSPPDNLSAGVYLAHVGEESTKRRRTLCGLIFSGYAGLARRENEGVAHQRLALTTLAVERFRNETGRLPERLDELAPKYLKEIPEDPFTGLEPEYRRTQNGFVIYSVGTDREDNGGLEKTDNKGKNSFDITFTVER